jgi:hypothetical protein
LLPFVFGWFLENIPELHSLLLFSTPHRDNFQIAKDLNFLMRNLRPDPLTHPWKVHIVRKEKLSEEKTYGSVPVSFRKEKLGRYGRVVMLACVLAWSVAGSLRAQEGWLTVHADQTLHPLSRTLTGACLEDVNHEVYGGIDSQMLYGESFQEPAPLPSPLEGFKAWGGDWKLENGELTAKGENGPKLVRDAEPFSDGEVGVEILLPDRSAGNAGLILKVNRPGVGADNFDGYEISLDAALQIVRLGRHRHNWEHIRDIPCEIPTGGWIPLKVQIQGPSLKVWVQDQCVLEYEEQNPLKPGTVGLRPWGREVRYRNLWVRPESKDDGPIQKIPFTATRTRPLAVSGMWRAIKTGTALGEFSLETGKPFSGVQSQRLSFKSGEGSIGIENQGLNRWGLNLLAGKVYEGFLYVRAEKPVELTVALESRNGRASYDEKHLAVTDTDWKRVDFTLTPTSSDPAGRFALRLDKQGSVSVGYAFLQPGDWGRFKGLPVRRDVAEGLIEQGITVLRYGGCMANAAEYRWKKMIGPRENRPPYKGWWYPYSSNGWGIVDFMNFCEAAGFEYIPDFNASETPQDMVDFIEYAKGPADSEWGKRRVADGHPAPYRLRYLQIGNEERVDQRYFDKFKPTAEAIWAKDPEVILVVGDFQYTKPITDPMKFEGSVVGITSLTAQSKILDLARAHNREVWFDLHVNTEGPRPDASLEGMRSFTDALESWLTAPDTRSWSSNQRREPRAETSPGQRPGHRSHRARWAHPDGGLRQLPPARRSERQRLEPGTPVSRSFHRLVAAPRLCDSNARAPLPAGGAENRSGGPGPIARRDRHA